MVDMKFYIYVIGCATAADLTAEVIAAQHVHPHLLRRRAIEARYRDAGKRSRLARHKARAAFHRL
jgi:hypothetical protein